MTLPTQVLVVLLISGAASASLTLPANAMTAQALQSGVQNYVAAELEHAKARQLVTRWNVTVGPLDTRLQLQDCAKPLTYTPQSTGGKAWGRTTIQVSCDTQIRWSLYVPATITAYGPVVVTNTALSKNQLISAENVYIEERELNSIGTQFFANLDQVIGKATRSNVSAGAVMGPGAVEEPVLVKRGDTVSIRAQAGGIAVVMQGTAKANGRKGQQITVENTSSKRIIRAQVTGIGQVATTM